MDWSFDWVRAWDAIWEPGRLAHWRAAAAHPSAHATPFMHPDVVRAWVEATGGEAAYAPFLLHARHADGQEVLWLLVRPRPDWRTGFLRRLIPAGGALFDYHDPVAVPAAAPDAALAPGFWPALERDLERRAGVWFDSCALSRIRPGCAAGGRFPGTAGSAALLRLDAHADFDAYVASRRGSIAGLNRKRARLAAERDLRFCMHGPGDTEAVLAWLPDLEAARAARYPGSTLPAGYLRGLARAGVGQGLVRGSTLAFGDRIVSWDLSFYLGGVFYGYMRAFDPAFGRVSPGLLHGHAVVEWLFDQGAHTFDFLLGADSYKNDWTDGETVTPRSGAIRSRALATLSRQYARRGLQALGGARAARGTPEAATSDTD